MISLPDFKYKQLAIHIAGGTGEIVRFRADNIIIEDANRKIIFQHSCHRMFALFIIGETSLTSALIKNAVSFAFPIILMSRNLKVITRINSSAEGNILLRQKQYQLYDQSLLIAKQLVRQKINNQLALLKNLRTPSAEDKAAMKELAAIFPEKADDISQLMGIEGNASKIFFQAYFRVMNWQRREPRCKRDINNLLLDIGYTYLFNFMEGMLDLYGFDIYCGVLHRCFYQRKSLVCDLVEPFRCIIDRRLRKAYNLKQIDPDDFYIENHQYRLKYQAQEKYIRLFMKDILAEKENIFIYVQQYYRWFIKNKAYDDFPVFNLAHD